MKECLDDTILQSYFDGELSGEQLENVSSHLAMCQGCAVTAREIEAETAMLSAALAPEFEAAVPSEELRRRIDAAIAGARTKRAVVNESSTFSIGAWLQSLLTPLSFAPQRAVGYAGLILVLGFGAFLGITQWRSAVPTQVAESTPITKTTAGAVTPEQVDPAPVAPVAIASPSSTTADRKFVPTARSKNVRENNSRENIAKKNTVTDDNKVKLLPGERSYLQTIAKLDSTINANNRPMRPSLQVEYQRNLALVDRALAATRDAAKKNPNDPDAAEFMMAAYQNKVNLLNAVAEARTFNRQQD